MSSSDGCLHLAEMYVGESGRDNEYGRRSAVIECLACGALRLDDEAVRQDDDLYARYDVMPPEMDMCGPSRVEQLCVAALLATAFALGLACIAATIWTNRP